MKLQVKHIPVRTLLLMEKNYADMKKGVIRDYKMNYNGSNFQTPKLSKMQQREFARVINPENYEELSGTSGGLSYRVNQGSKIGV